MTTPPCGYRALHNHTLNRTKHCWGFGVPEAEGLDEDVVTARVPVAVSCRKRTFRREDCDAKDSLIAVCRVSAEITLSVRLCAQAVSEPFTSRTSSAANPAPSPRWAVHVRHRLRQSMKDTTNSRRQTRRCRH